MLSGSRYDIIIKPEYIDTEKTKYTSLSYIDPANYNYVSRYSNVNRIYDKNNIAYHETGNTLSIPESADDKYYKVDNISVNRLDIIAYKFYGYSIYWWIIAVANEIIDPFNIELDTILRIPPLSSIYTKGSVLGE